MERREGWLGYVAVGLGALALMVALFGSGSPTQVDISLPAAGYAQMPVVVPAAPAAPADVAPVIPPLPEQFAMPPNFDRLPEAERRKLKSLQEQMRDWRNQKFEGPFSTHRQEIWVRRNVSDHGWGPPAFVPMILKLVVATLAIGFGMRLLRGGTGGHTPAPPGPPSMA